MTSVVFIEFDGTERRVEATVNQSLMQVAISNGIRGIDAACGGSCACATCHVYVDPAWMDIIGEPTGTECDLLEFVSRRTEYSRLSCQIPVTERLQGLVVRLPESQVD